MRRIGFYLATLVVVVSGPGVLIAVEETNNQTADFQEVYDTVRSHLDGIDEKELNRLAVEGFLAALRPRVLLVTNDEAATAAAAKTLPVAKTSIFEGSIGYARIQRVEKDLAQAIRQAHRELSATNKLKGLVLDLRYATGEDYAAAAAAADLFVKKARPLLNWGNGVVRSTEKEDAITIPVAVLVNHETAAAAEALAAVLRETGAGLVLGSVTAGQATVARDFTLKNGNRLRIATAPIQFGEEGVQLPAGGLKPDIAVEVPRADERAYYADAFVELPKAALLAGANLSLTNEASGTNRATRRSRLNEAELVRERREGLGLDSGTGTGSRTNAELEKPVVHDPALARALDLLKGLAVVRQSRS